MCYENFMKGAVFTVNGLIMDMQRKSELSEIARQIRIGIIEAVHSAKSGHPGGSLSIADVLAYLYNEEMNIDPAKPTCECRDRLVLSKGHCAPGLYAALANRGYFPVEDLKTFRHTTSYLQGHPDMKHTPGVDMSSGSLGQGASVSCGMALASKMDNHSRRIYAILGDPTDLDLNFLKTLGPVQQVTLEEIFGY